MGKGKWFARIGERGGVKIERERGEGERLQVELWTLKFSGFKKKYILSNATFCTSCDTLINL